MDIGRVFSDAWRYTFREKAQWGFSGIILAAWVFFGVAYTVSYVALLNRMFGASASYVFSPSYEALPADPDTFGAPSPELVFGLLALVLVAAVVGTYMRAFMDSGLVFSAGAIARGQRPTLADTVREGFGSSWRVWGTHFLSLYLPMLGLYIVMAMGFGLVGVLGAATAAQTESDAFPPAICLGFLIMLAVFAVGAILLESWAQLSVRHLILWRQGVFAALGQGAQVLRARLGYSVLVVLSYIGSAMVAGIVSVVLSSVVLGSMPERIGPFVAMALAVPYYGMVFAITVYFANVWTAFVLQARPEAGAGPASYAPAFQPPAYGYPTPPAYAPPAPPQGYPIAQPPAAPPQPPAPEEPPAPPPPPPDDAGV